MLEIWNLVRKYRHIHDFRKYETPLKDPLSFAKITFFCKKSALNNSTYKVKNSTCTHSNSKGALLEIFQDHVSFTKQASAIRLSGRSKLVRNWKKDSASQFLDMMLWSNFFDLALFLLSSLVTGPSFMAVSILVLELTIFLYRPG